MSTKQNPSSALTERFIKGLKNYNISFNDIKNGQWTYAGGCPITTAHKYFIIRFPDFQKKWRETHIIDGKNIYIYYRITTHKPIHSQDDFPDKNYPRHINKCVCNHDIEKNYYITNGSVMLILGSCCIKKFMPNGMRKSCEHCENLHKNIKDNLCNDCRKYILLEFELTKSDIKEDWKYAGSSNGLGRKYFKSLFPAGMDDEPDDGIPHQDTCDACENPIDTNYYITDTKDLITFGTCCIDKIKPGCLNTCDKCGGPDCLSYKIGTEDHLSILWLCLKCKSETCICGKKINPKYKMCYKCKAKDMINNCNECDKIISRKYTKCYRCNRKTSRFGGGWY